MIYLVEISGLPPGSNTLTTLLYSTGEGYVTGPTDTPPNTVYLPRVSHPGIFERHSWSPGTTRGRGEVSYGSIELVNVDGKLDFLAGWDLDGRALTILRGLPTASRTTFTTCLSGTMDGCAVSWSSVMIRVRDAAAFVAEKPVITERYLGNNLLPAGTEGVATDLKSKTKPLVLGEAENFAPPRVNTSVLVYQASAKSLNSILGVYDNGNAITAGVARANLAALMATPPAAGVYDYSLGSSSEGAYFRLGSTPGTDTVTCYARSAVAAGCTVAQLATYVLGLAGVAGASILGATDLDAVQPAIVGMWIDIGSDATGATDLDLATSGTKVGDVLDALCSSIGACWTPNRAGAFVLQRLVPPTGVAAATFSAVHIIGEISLLPTEDNSRGVPSYETELHYAKNYNVMTGPNVAGAVAAPRMDWLKLEYRAAKASNATIWDPVARTGRNPTSLPTVVDTLIRVEADAIAEATRLLALYSVRRTYVSFVVTAPAAASVDLGTIITLDTTRFSLAGKLLVVTGMIEDFSANTTTIFAWG